MATGYETPYFLLLVADPVFPLPSSVPFCSSRWLERNNPLLKGHCRQAPRPRSLSCLPPLRLWLLRRHREAVTRWRPRQPEELGQGPSPWLPSLPPCLWTCLPRQQSRRALLRPRCPSRLLPALLESQKRTSRPRRHLPGQHLMTRGCARRRSPSGLGPCRWPGRRMTTQRSGRLRSPAASPATSG